MDEYIERRKLEEAFDNAHPDVCESDLDGHSDWGFGRENVRDVIRGVPAADVAPVIRGCWTRYSTSMMSCTICGRHTAWHKFSYCPHCGARMDGGSQCE